LSAVTGFVVAGGRSRRMGSDKALLRWEGGTLLDHAIARLQAVTDDVRILSGAARRYEDRGLPVITDGDGGPGALVGLLAGLSVLERPFGLFLAVDLPHVTVPLLRHLLQLADGADAVVPLSAGGAEPLCAAYAKSCLAPVRDAVARGDFKMTGFWGKVHVREVPAGALAAFGESSRLFLNLNAPEDYARADTAAAWTSADDEQG
jgi:molybdopterin-guanine dinucleotide biosynthesis protein A